MKYAKTLTPTFIILISFFQSTGFAQESKLETKVRGRFLAFNDLLKISGNVNFESGYLSNNSYGESGYYSVLALHPRIVISRIPVTLNWNIVKGPQTSLKPGRFSLKFSRETLINFLNESKLDSIKSATNIPNEYSIARTWLSDKEYLKSVSDASMLYHSMKTDSAAGGLSTFDDLKMDSLRTVLQEYDSYQAALNIKNYSKTNKGLISNSTDSIISLPVTDKNQLNQSLSADTSLPHGLNLSASQKLFMRFNKLSLGYDVLDNSMLSIQGYPYFGGSVDYIHNGFILGIAGGKHSNYYNPLSFGYSSASSFSPQFTSGSSMVHVKTGIGDLENNTILSLTNFYGVGLGAFNENVETTYDSKILNLKTRKKIEENSTIEFEISKILEADKNHEDRSAQGMNLYAFQLQSSNSLPRLNAKVKIGYMNIGDQFETPGNPYLNKGFQLLNAGISKSILNERISTELSITESWSNTNSESAPDWKRFSTSILVRYKLNSSCRIQVRRLINKMNTSVSAQIVSNSSVSDQMGVNFEPAKNINVSLQLVKGKTIQNENVTSQNYMCSSSAMIRFAKHSLQLQANYSQTKTMLSSRESESVTIGENIVLGKKLSVRLSSGLTFNPQSYSALFAYGLNYLMSKHLSVEVSGNSNKYYFGEYSYWRYQASCGANLIF